MRFDELNESNYMLFAIKFYDNPQSVTKEDFEEHLKSDKPLFNVQQGGKKVGNDDYICTKVANLLECKFVKDISEW